MSATPDIWITNSKTHKKELFKPITPGKVSFYSCGPTVYDLIHIGNLRAAMSADLFYRALTYLGLDVTYVRNFTDVDDKIINKANVEKTTTDVIADRYTAEVEKDYALFGLKQPTHKTTVRTHMAEIISMIESIIKNGCGYVVDGEVFFAIENFKTYGHLSGRNLEDLAEGQSRIEKNSKKKNPLDFTLWKPMKPGEPSWDSPWGKGRPGWHIECSAMATKWLGPSMDLHHGGEDLVFPHHENEVAQSEAATGKTPYVGCWVHNAFLNLNAEKMSKSIGNVITARAFGEKYTSEVARYLLLSVHYRTIIDFNEDSLHQALAALGRIYEAKQKAIELTKVAKAVPDMVAENAWGTFMMDADACVTNIKKAYAHDLSTPDALAALFVLIREFNRVCALPRAQATPTAILGAQALIKIIEHDIGEVFGIGRLTPERMFEISNGIKQSMNKEGLTPEQIEALIAERIDARKNKNFARGDEIRKELDAKGVVIKDSPQGTTWEYK